MLFFQITKRLEEAEKRVAALEEAIGGGRALPQGSEEEGEKPVYRLDDLKLQEGISNLMGYDPFGQKRRNA